MNLSITRRLGFASLWVAGLTLASTTLTGCQVDVAGQTMPSPYHLTDDVQYYAPGPEFKLAREAAALEEQKANHVSHQQAP